MDEKRPCLGLLRRRQILLPTWRGWLLLVLVGGGLALLAMLEVGPFLSVTDPAPGGVLVVEGWGSDYMLKATITEFRHNHYSKVFVTGIPLERGEPLSEYKNMAFIGAATLVKLGLSTNDVQAVPTPKTRRDRTYAMALSLKHWLRSHGPAPTRVTLVTGGPHARRSRLLYQMALGEGITVGVIAVPPEDYDERSWWHSSAGVRSIIGETLAYAYARLLFHPPKDAP
jgi:uncharacterized SAM-binding protein YcdF (DUF218 family)